MDDPSNETEDELAQIEQLCSQACSEHFAADLGLSANCEEPGAFETPVRHEESDPAIDLLRTDASHGEDLFVGQSLECDLTEDCYTEFDEALRVAVPSRFTPGEDMLAVGEEYSLGVAGEMGAESSFASGPVAASLVGTVGYSECVGGNEDGPCPFYMGSLELTLSEPLLLELDCDNVPVTYEVEELTIRLGQPAFGIAEEDTWWRAFPPGAMILEAEGVINEMPFYSRRPNQSPFYVFASEGWIQMQGINGSWLELSVPCGEEQADILAWWGFEAVDWPGEPPHVSIDVPSTVTCPDDIDLDHTKVDSESDFASLRWLVDGVLMEDGTTSVEFTTGHELTAIVRDERGATHTKQKQVSCL